MDADEFWTIMEDARAAAESTMSKVDGEDGEPIARELIGRLVPLGTDAVLSFDSHLARATAVLHRWDVWAAAYLIANGCGDDSFIDFKTGIVTLGRTWHQRAVANPDSLADHPTVVRAAAGGYPYALFAENVNYVGGQAVDQITGTKRASRRVYRAHRFEPLPVDMGEDFDFNDPQEMTRRLPRLAAMFLGPLAP